MLAWLRAQYSRRIVNVNVNVVLSGVLALALTLIPVHLTRYVGVHDPWVITGVTFVADVIFDVLLYYVLHWLANHWPGRGRTREAGAMLAFMKDATLVQFERAMLGPVYYISAIGMQQRLLHMGMDRELATVLAFLVGIALTRVLHTIWMLRTERRQRAVAAGARLPEGAHAGVAGAREGAASVSRGP